MHLSGAFGRIVLRRIYFAKRTGFFGNPLSFRDAVREMKENVTDNLKNKFSIYCLKVDH